MGVRPATATLKASHERRPSPRRLRDRDIRQGHVGEEVADPTPRRGFRRAGYHGRRMKLDRRAFLLAGAAAAGVTWARPFELLAASGEERISPGYGPLRPVRDGTTGLPLVKLPPGFRYFSLGWLGDRMEGGLPTPPGHDGGAAFAGADGRILYIRNHELLVDPRLERRTSFAPPSLTYDPGEAPGGVTGVVFDPRSGRAGPTRPLLSGTIRNCAGGPTPWGSWLSCEETLDAPGAATRDARIDRTHGWVFEVPADGRAAARPLRGLGRMWHEAVAVDPRTGILYETEDREYSGLYRFLPARPGDLARGGRLEMLAVPGEPGLDTGRGMEPGRWLPVSWVPIPDPERAHTSPASRDGLGVMNQGLEQGAATFRRGEGIWQGHGRVYFVASTGGRAGAGQVFELDPEQSRLRLLFESPGLDVLNRPDNLAVSPRGGIVLCEDSKRRRPFLRGLPPPGELFDFAQNAVVLDGERNGLRGDFRSREWAGACFSPDGRWLFANVQWPGITFAITGPWERGLL